MPRTDESVEVARKLAPLSPVPMQIVVNEHNGGSTFRQWLKGLSLATGDLIWIAESDDSAHPLLLERIVPEFYDPDVMLAYCQSAIIGPGGETLAENFLAHTDDISTDALARPLFRCGRPGSRARPEPEEHDSQRQRRRISPAGSARFRGRARQAPLRRRLVLLRHADPDR